MPSDEADLVKLAAAGDREAFDRLLEAHWQSVQRFCGRFFPNAEEARDAAVQVFERAWNKLGAFRHDCAISTWLYRVAQSVCLNILRTRKGITLSIDSPDGLQVAESPDGKPSPDKLAEWHQMVAAVIARLPEESDRLIFWFHYQHGMSDEEIANALPPEMRLKSDGVHARIYRRIRPAISAVAREFGRE